MQRPVHSRCHRSRRSRDDIHVHGTRRGGGGGGGVRARLALADDGHRAAGEDELFAHDGSDGVRGRGPRRGIHGWRVIGDGDGGGGGEWGRGVGGRRGGGAVQDGEGFGERDEFAFEEMMPDAQGRFRLVRATIQESQRRHDRSDRVEKRAHLCIASVGHGERADGLVASVAVGVDVALELDEDELGGADAGDVGWQGWGRGRGRRGQGDGDDHRGWKRCALHNGDRDATRRVTISHVTLDGLVTHISDSFRSSSGHGRSCTAALPQSPRAAHWSRSRDMFRACVARRW